MPNQPAAGQVHLTLYLPRELRDRAKAAAAANRESISTAVRRALEEYANRHEHEKAPHPALASAESEQ